MFDTRINCCGGGTELHHLKTKAGFTKMHVRRNKMHGAHTVEGPAVRQACGWRIDFHDCPGTESIVHSRVPFRRSEKLAAAHTQQHRHPIKAKRRVHGRTPPMLSPSSCLRSNTGAPK